MKKILIVCSGFPTNNQPYRNVFIKEQIESMQRLDQRFQFDIFQINEKRSTINYAKAIFKLNAFANRHRYDIFHAHFGLSALTSVWQQWIPVIVTYHGCDINARYSRLYAKSILAHRVRFCIFVNRQQSQLMKNPKNSAVVPCGIDMDQFYPIDKGYARSKLGLHNRKKYVVFPADRRRMEKKFVTAKKAIEHLKSNSVELIELTGYTRDEVNYVLNAADTLLMTSIREGSPQTIKEAMACNLPIVSTDVGDVRDLIGTTKWCFITSPRPIEIAHKIERILECSERTNGREQIEHLELNHVAKRILLIYAHVLATIR